MISSLHDWRLLFFTPDLGAPITYREEVFGVRWVSVKVIDWSMMFTTVITESILDFNSLSFVCLEYVTLLSSDEVLQRTSFGVVFKRGTTKNLCFWLGTFNWIWNSLLKNERFSWNLNIPTFTLLVD